MYPTIHPKGVVGIYAAPKGARAAGDISSLGGGGGVGGATARLQTCTVVTTNAVFDVHPARVPDEIFLQLLERKRDPEPLGASLRLDLKSLYEEGALEATKQNNHLRALELYMLAKSPYHRVIPSLVKNQQMKYAAFYLSKALSDPAALTATARKGLSDLLLCCYVEQLCHAGEEGDGTGNRGSGGDGLGGAGTGATAAATGGSGSDGDGHDAQRAAAKSAAVGRRVRSISDRSTDRLLEESSSPETFCSTTADLYRTFVKFVADNWDYNVDSALQLLTDYGMLDLFFHVAVARQRVEKSLEQIVHSGCPGLSKPTQELLYTKGYAHIVCNFQDGIVLKCMAPDDQVRFLTGLDDIGLCLHLAKPLLPDLVESSLEELARFFDPAKPDIASLISGNRHRTRSIEHARSNTPEPSMPPPSADKLVEMFLEVLLALRHVRGTQVQPMPWGVKTKELFASSTSTHGSGSGNSTDTRNDGEGSAATQTGEWDSAGVQKSATETRQLNDSRLALGANHGAAVVDGDVYTWGKAKHGRLGHGGIVEEQDFAPWCRVETLHIHSIRIAGVACGASHMFAFGDDGMYAWGEGANGKLGLGDELSRNVPTEVRGVGRVRDVSCGNDFTLALLADRSVLSWGGGASGQLGTGNYEDQLKPVRITQVDGEQFVQISTGHSHSALFSAKGSVYMFGDNGHRQLGRRAPDRVPVPTVLDVPAHMGAVRGVTCGRYTTFLLCRHGAVATSIDGGSGNAEAFVDIDLPCAPTDVRQVSLGDTHGIILAGDGTMSAWGAGMHGQLGLGATEFAERPRRVQVFKDTDDDWALIGDPVPETFSCVGASGDFSIALDGRGHVWVWGQGEYGELGGLDAAMVEVRAPERMHPDAGSMQPRSRTLSEQSNHSVSSMDGLVGTPRLGIAFDKYHGKGASERVQARINAGSSGGGGGGRSGRGGGEGGGGGGGGDGQMGKGVGGKQRQGVGIPGSPARKGGKSSTGAVNGGGGASDGSNDNAGGQLSPNGQGSGEGQDVALPDGPGGAAAAALYGLRPYSGPNLVHAMIKFAGRFNVNSVLRKCMDWKNWDAVASLYTKLNDFALAYEFRIRALSTFVKAHREQWRGDDEAQRAFVEAYVLETTPWYINAVANEANADPARQKRSEKATASILSQFLHFWGGNALGNGLEAFLVQHLTHIHKPLSSLVERAFAAQQRKQGGAIAAAGGKGSPPTAAAPPSAAAKKLPAQLTKFATSFYVKLARAKIGKQDPNALNASMHVSQDRLWVEIMDNLAKDVNARSKIDLSVVPAATVNVGASTEIDTVLFTCCSTTIPRRQFYELELPEFTRRFEALPIPLTQSAAALLQDYSKPRISMSCPSCLFTKVRREQQTAMPDVYIPPWGSA